MLVGWKEGEVLSQYLNYEFSYLKLFSFNNSLIATIKERRPDLLRSFDDSLMTNPIPETVPSHYFEKQVHFIEDIGEPMTACFFTLSEVDPTNWYSMAFFICYSSKPFDRWMFEKYDGVRGFWNPLKRKFFSRSGKELPLPQEVTDSMPTTLFLDGELW